MSPNTNQTACVAGADARGQLYLQWLSNMYNMHKGTHLEPLGGTLRDFVHSLENVRCKTSTPLPPPRLKSTPRGGWVW